MKKWIQRKPKVAPRKNDDIIDAIAKIRGIKDVDNFLSPSANALHDPYLLKNIEDVSNRIIRAIASGERIVVSYDPDADGLTATSTMLRYLGNYSDKVRYIYGERNDGHGIAEMIKIAGVEEDVRLERNTENLQIIHESDLVILIDSSSNDTDACRYIAEEMGKEIIILDHHGIERENPYVLMVNPQQEGCLYPNKFLSGAGVVFKVMQVMEDTLGQVDPFDYIDLVAVGMYADIMRVDVLENRYLIMNGLRNMKNTGLVRILKGGKADLFKLDCNSIGFTIAPLLNGTARMDNIKLAIDILLSDDDTVCKKLRLQMSKLNDKRKEIQKGLVEAYSKKVNLDQKVLVVLDDKSSKGFNGIIAQQLSEKFKRPVIVGRLHKGVASGSFRSYNGFKFKSFLQDFDGEIEALGHEGAGGIIIAEENLDALNTYIERCLPELDEKGQTVIYDLEIDVADIVDYIKPIERFNLLTGNGFYKIIVKINGITVEEPECIGKTMETVKIRTYDEMELIKFRVDENYASELGHFDTIDAVGVLSMNEFYNFGLKKKICTPQLMIEDYVKSE
ncbi:RecJ-type single-stranded DNA-specific exonuclease [Bacillus phage Kirov]|uniref:RecJ-type single-stranded DNA-specific exonuclease n=1 Tax=Bacillus phage Kirov TaxID=2783539 RepID=A0A7U3NKI3_9CAUD|nr:RecJ-type single-stranded DNA-specific exonuclease [Bacillus phage Kirov]QOV08363.1 RecJ-type single-stranded DNA-specific exonuclease [Bacillus phage Kirov]